MKHDDTLKIIITIAVIAVLVFVSSSGRNNNEDLQLKYDELEDKYNSLEATYSDAINRCEDPLAVLYCYFEYEDDITFEEAHDAFKIINQQISQFY